MRGKQASTIFLRLVVFLIGILILGLGIFALPLIAKEAAEYYPGLILYPVLISVYLTVIPIFYALHQTLKLLSYIDENKAFSDLSVKALKNIKYCAITISILYAACMPIFYIVGEVDDAPGLILFGLIFTFAPIVIAVFAAVLQKLLKNAIDIKNDNDLTI